METRVVVTSHAVDRFVKRYRPEMVYADARILLEERVRAGSPLKRRPVAGGHAWKIQDPDAVVVVKRDGRQIVVLTVLPAEADE